MKRYLLLLAITILCATAGANTLSEALDASRRGDFQAAYPLWVSLAESGDDKAMVEVGLMHHRGQGVEVNYAVAMDWYLKAYKRNGDALNNIGVMYRDGLGVQKNRKISYLLFLLVHMEGIGGEATVMRANRNLRREIAEQPKADLQEAVCYTVHYLVAYVESRGSLTDVPDHLRASSTRKRIKELGWWAPGEVGQFDCPAGT